MIPLIKLPFLLKKTIKTISCSGITYFSSSNSSNPSFYEILEVSPKCSLPEIKQAYYKKVKIYHPDRNKDPEAEQKFKQIVKAYETLKDPTARYVYDMGQINPVFNESSGVSDEYMYSDLKNYQRKKSYYENKWYSFKKDFNENLRDEYSKKKKENEQFQSIHVRFLFVIFIIVLFDFLNQSRYRKHEAIRKFKKHLIDNEENSPLIIKDAKNGIIMELNQYIKEREKEYSEEK